MKTDLDLAKAVVKEVRRIAADHPTTKYYSPEDAGEGNSCGCFYTMGVAVERVDGRATRLVGEGCLVGRAIAAVVPEYVSTLRSKDEELCSGGVYDNAANRMLDDIVDDLALEIEDTLPKSRTAALLSSWLDTVQRQQDGGVLWGEAVEHADDFLGTNLSDVGVGTN